MNSIFLNILVAENTEAWAFMAAIVDIMGKFQSSSGSQSREKLL